MEPTDKQRSNYLGAVFTGLCIGALMLVCLGAATTGPFPPSPFTLRTGTNTTPAGWRAVLGVSTNHGGSFTNAALIGGSVTGQTNSDLTASRVVVSSSAKVPASSSVTTTELGYLSGVTNSIQSELNAKATAANLVTVSNAQVTTDGKLTGYVTNLGGFATNAALTGGTVTSQTNLDLTASRVMLSDANKVPTSSSVTATTLAFLDATSSVQTQLDAKPTVALTNVALLNGTNNFTGPNTITNTGNSFFSESYGTAQQSVSYSGGTNLVTDASKVLHFALLTNTTYFAAPANLRVGRSFTILVRQDGTGARAVTFDTTIWKFPQGVPPSITTNANANDVLSCVVCPYGTNVFAVHNAFFF